MPAPRPLRVLVTRPAHDAQRWVTALRAALRASVTVQAEVLALPLIEILPAADRASIDRVWADPGPWQALMFVSANAVEHFFAAGGTRRTWPAGAIRAWAPGPGTRDALLSAGVPAASIDVPPDDAPQFDSEALWRVVGPALQPGERVLIVRGADALGRSAGRDWLARQITAVGAGVDLLAVYERHPPRLDAQQQALAHAALGDGSVWLFSSSEAVNNLRQALPGVALGKARAIATHPRIAQAARDAGFGVVCESRPALAALVASIESLA